MMRMGIREPFTVVDGHPVVFLHSTDEHDVFAIFKPDRETLACTLNVKRPGASMQVLKFMSYRALEAIRRYDVQPPAPVDIRAVYMQRRTPGSDHAESNFRPD